MALPVYDTFQASGASQTQADGDRVVRAFVGLANALLNDSQTYVGFDGSIANRTGQFMIATPDGTYSVQGQPRSNVQSVGSVGGVSISPLMLLVLAGAVFLALK